MQGLEAEAYETLREFVRGVEKAEKERREHAVYEARKKGRPRPSFPSFIFFRDVMEIAHAEDGTATVWVLKGEKEAWLKARESRAS